MVPNILIVTIENDIHALAVANELGKKGLAHPYLLEIDRLSNRYRINWTENQFFPNEIILPDHKGIVQLNDTDLIWWRRIHSNQILDRSYEEVQVELINNDWKATLRGALETMHEGVWISHPSATDRASNKLIQLQIAKQCGFCVPDTLISNDPVKVKSFIKKHSDRVIVKPVSGVNQLPLFTQTITQDDLNDESIMSVPAIYQELIPGNFHLRISCFGENIIASKIKTDDLDWRSNLNVPIETVSLDEYTVGRIKKILNKLDLAMGMIDLKIRPGGEIVWFEVNPQGQFLFLEGITNEPLLRQFCNYLSDTAKNGRIES